MVNKVPYAIEFYDEQLGFNAWHLECQGKFRRRYVAPGYSKFYTHGFDKLRVLDSSVVNRVLSQLRSLQNDNRSTWADEHVEWINYDHRKDAGWIYDVISQVLNEEMDRILVNFFRSEYMVHSVGFQRTFPSDPSKDCSYLWHRDAGPTAHLKIITYFTSGGETGAGTEFLDINVSSKIAEVGYSFPDLKERASDLGAYFDLAGITYAPLEAPIQAGEAVVFRPRDVLHCGVFSKNADKPRYAMALVIAPSTMPWKDACQLWPLFAAQHAVGVRIDPHYAPVLRGESRINVPNN